MKQILIAKLSNGCSWKSIWDLDAWLRHCPDSSGMTLPCVTVDFGWRHYFLEHSDVSFHSSVVDADLLIGVVLCLSEVATFKSSILDHAAVIHGLHFWNSALKILFLPEK